MKKALKNYHLRVFLLFKICFDYHLRLRATCQWQDISFKSIYFDHHLRPVNKKTAMFFCFTSIYFDHHLRLKYYSKYYSISILMSFIEY